GEEWSAILDTSQLEFDSLDQLPAMLPVEWGVHEVRTASMLKWFSARVDAAWPTVASGSEMTTAAERTGEMP
ncbi:MAG: hypothetical protein AAFP90_18860, partial [Planctomycetota bacterium]